MKCKILGWLVLSMTACASYNNTGNPDKVILLFSIQQDQTIYEQSIYGEPPQFAIWLENMETGKIQTVSVTHNTATGNFEGRAKVSVALPAWIGAFQKETGRDDIPTPQEPIKESDAISLPTPNVSEFTTQITVPAGSGWQYYVEVNVAGDYTTAFPLYQSNGARDLRGNGQPSIIYRGNITAIPGDVSTPELIGRTEQLYMSTEINPDLKGVKSATKLFKKIKVSCQ